MMMPALHTYRLFISHAWRYGDDYNRVVNLISTANNFSFKNYSVPVDKAFEKMSNADLKQQLRYQINPTECVIVLAGMYAHHSEWIGFEMEHARALGRPILGVIPWGQERTPKAVSDYATRMVGWNSASIVAGIREITP